MKEQIGNFLKKACHPELVEGSLTIFSRSMIRAE